MSIAFDRHHWALILGGSSGFGLATAQKLARHGMNIAIVHRDRRGAMASIETGFDAIREAGVRFASWNIDALSEAGKKTVLDDLTAHLAARSGDDEAGRVRMVMHSVASGNLKPIVTPHASLGDPARRARSGLAARLGITEEALGDAVRGVLTDDDAAFALNALADPPAYDPELVIGDEDFAQTIFNMGTSLASWTHDVHQRGLFAADARVLAMTSEGNEVAWRGYAAVSAAKVALESVTRSIAAEYAPYGVRANVVQAGVTDTAALRHIPGAAQLKASARLRNPFGRLTRPADVANFICLLCTDEAAWVNGAILRVDGGERIAG
ncbi:MAG: SDR family oxidoreductase [Myxococcales bacterium]|nr:SDR family oxidoreductase [Myxococcales bacterium]